MRNRVVILCMTGVLLLFGLNGFANSQQSDLPRNLDSDTVDLAIVFATAYPGAEELWLEVRMKNPVALAGFAIELTLSRPDLVKFCLIDTADCIIDTSGCEMSIFQTTHCGGEEALAWVVGFGDLGTFIPPHSDYRCLFKICMDVCCIPDSTTDRSTYVYVNPGKTSFSDTLGQMIPYRWHQGEVVTWWSVSGDASNDSLVTLGDIVFLINYLFRGGPELCVCEAADCNHDCAVNLNDVIYLINYLYRGGSKPVPGCYYCPHENCWH
jgi:hypothetical protein